MSKKSKTASLASLAFAVTIGCSPTEPDEFLDARLSAMEDSVQPGAVSIAHLEVTNHGDDPIEIEVQMCPPRIVVFDRRGMRLGHPPVSCQAIPSVSVTLEPGETYGWVQGWIAGDGSGAPLPPGSYQLQAWVVPVGGGLPVLTNRVAVTVGLP